MVGKMFFTLFGILMFGNVVGQDQHVVDSLNLVLERQTGGDRYPALHWLAVEYSHSDNEKALQIALEAVRAADKSGDSVWIVKSHRLKSQILARLGNIEEVISISEFYYPIARRLDLEDEAISIANAAGMAFVYKGQFDKGLQYFFECYEVAKQHQDSSALAMALHNIGVSYYKLKDYKKGLHYLENCFRLKESFGIEDYMTSMNISLCYVYLDRFAEARVFLNRAMRVCGEGCPDPAMVHIQYTSGCIFLGLKQYDSAEVEFLSSLSVAKSLDDPRMQLDNIYLLSGIYLEQNRRDRALHFLEEAEKLTFQGTPFNMEMIKIYSRFSDLYFSIKDFEKAAAYQKKYITLKDSIYNEVLTTSLMKTESEFLERENKAKIDAQNEIIVLKEEVIRRQANINILIGLAGGMAVAFLVLLYRNYKKNKDHNIVLDQKIRERTQELEVSRNKLLTTLRQTELTFRRGSNVMNERINTLKGLCFTARREVSDPAALAYIEKVDSTSRWLDLYLRTAFRERNLV